MSSVDCLPYVQDVTFYQKHPIDHQLWCENYAGAPVIPSGTSAEPLGSAELEHGKYNFHHDP